LLVPAGFLQDVETPISVHVADSHAVREFLHVTLLADRHECPCLRGVLRVEDRVAVASTGRAHELGPAVAVEIDERGGLVVDGTEDEVALPGPPFRAGVLEPGRVFAREADEKQVERLVAVEIVEERKEVVRVAFHVVGLGRVDLVADFEFRPLVPVGARDDVGYAIARDVSVRRALAGEHVGELHALEGVNPLLFIGVHESSSEDQARDDQAQPQRHGSPPGGRETCGS
jgi:hypothetical protein